MIAQTHGFSRKYSLIMTINTILHHLNNDFNYKIEFIARQK